MPVAVPGLQDPLGEAVLTGTPHVVRDLLVATLLERLPDARGDVVQRLVPGDPLPLAAPALDDPLQRVQDALGVVELVDGRRALGAVAAAGSRMSRVALDLLHAQIGLVDVGEQPARGLTVEARGRHEHVLVRHLARMRLRVVLDVVVPVLHRREVPQVLVGPEAG